MEPPPPGAYKTRPGRRDGHRVQPIGGYAEARIRDFDDCVVVLRERPHDDSAARIGCLNRVHDQVAVNPIQREQVAFDVDRFGRQLSGQ